LYSPPPRAAAGSLRRPPPRRACALGTPARATPRRRARGPRARTPLRCPPRRLPPRSGAQAVSPFVKANCEKPRGYHISGPRVVETRHKPGPCKLRVFLRSTCIVQLQPLAWNVRRSSWNGRDAAWSIRQRSTAWNGAGLTGCTQMCCPAFTYIPPFSLQKEKGSVMDARWMS
jgi:hypothetical protein